MEDWTGLGRLVRERRQDLDLTQQQACDVAGVSHQTWHYLENAVRPVNDRTLRKVDRALGWAPRSARAILEGARPVEGQVVPPTTLAECRDRIVELEMQVGALKLQLQEQMGFDPRLRAEEMRRAIQAGSGVSARLSPQGGSDNPNQDFAPRSHAEEMRDAALTPPANLPADQDHPSQPGETRPDEPGESGTGSRQTA